MLYFCTTWYIHDRLNLGGLSTSKTGISFSNGYRSRGKRRSELCVSYHVYV